MARSNPGRTNEKLYFAQLFLQNRLHFYAEGQVINRNAIGKALCETVVQHLQTAYRSLLFEIIQSYHLDFSEDEILAAQQLEALCQNRGHTIPEIIKLSFLERDPLCWLSQLQAQFLSVNSILPREKKSLFSGADDIRMMNSDTENLEFLERCHFELAELVAEIREGLEEW